MCGQSAADGAQQLSGSAAEGAHHKEAQKRSAETEEAHLFLRRHRERRRLQYPSIDNIIIHVLA